MESEDGITSITDFYTDCADAELFQNGRDAGVFAVGSDGSDPPAGKRTWEKAVRQDRKESVNSKTAGHSGHYPVPFSVLA